MHPNEDYGTNIIYILKDWLFQNRLPMNDAEKVSEWEIQIELGQGYRERERKKQGT